MEKKMKQGREKGSFSASAVLLRIVTGGVAGTVVCGAGLLLCALLIAGGAIGEGRMGAVVLACAMLGGLGAGTVAAWGMRGRCIPVGVSAGAVMFLILMAAGVLAYERTSFEYGGAGLALMCCCGGGLAGTVKLGGGKRRRR